MNINKYDKVVVNDPRFTSDTLIGTVINTYAVTPDNVAIVHLEATGETVKIPFSNLRKYEPQEKQESKTEIPEGARRITEGEFSNAVSELMLSTDPKNFLFDMSGLIVGLNIAKALFEDTDVIYVTEDQLVKTLWDGCSPERIAATTNGDMSLSHCMVISTTALVTMKKLVEVFFPDGGENA